ncbi:MAG: hypothetical protein O2967_17370 [Proteobacteria bacterium]|nr:hypothetical protein [Pseudomonadota bacterium]
MIERLLNYVRPKRPKTAQASELEGDGNVVVQVSGDGNSVVVGYSYLRLTRFLNRRFSALPDPTETDLLQAHSRSIALLGRETELSELWDWLNDGRAISARVIIGSAGRGKSRLALELCEQAAAQGWRAGFLTGADLERFRAQQNAGEWGWNAPTLAVIDYAATGAKGLNAWLRELSDHAALTQVGTASPLRLLLLERQAEPNAAGSWWHTVFGGGDGTGQAVGRLLDRPEPVVLQALEGDASRRAVMAAMLEQIGSELQVPAAREDAYFDQRLSALTWGGEPLFLMMAALLASKSDFAAVLGPVEIQD